VPIENKPEFIFATMTAVVGGKTFRDSNRPIDRSDSDPFRSLAPCTSILEDRAADRQTLDHAISAT
jgi:hypothetical protein